MKIGLQFENILKRGLLEHAFALDNRDPTFRYAYHEVIEEAHHGMMFQEFVNRTPFDLPGLPWIDAASARIASSSSGRRFPQLFFMFVLGGEDPIDHVQREALRHDRRPPSADSRSIMRHHVTEEARHLSFARHYLKREVPQLSWMRRQVLSVATPLILGTMAQMMMQAPGDLISHLRHPRRGRARGLPRQPEPRSATRSCRCARSAASARELGIINAAVEALWQALGIWDDDVRPERRSRRWPISRTAKRRSATDAAARCSEPRLGPAVAARRR